KLNDQLKRLKREEEERRRMEEKLRAEEGKRRELEALLKQEMDQRRYRLELDRYYEALSRHELERPFQVIAQAIKDLKKFAGDDKSKQEAVADFEKSFGRVQDQMRPKVPPLPKEKAKTGGSGGGGPAKSPFWEGGVDPFGGGTNDDGRSKDRTNPFRA